MAIETTSVGQAGTLSVRVDDSLSADKYGNSGLFALATPALVGLCERAAMRAIQSLLESGQRTVGSVVELKHQAPTPVGDTVTVNAVISEVDGAKVWFDLSATDSKGEIASGRHARFVVDDARFLDRLERHPGASTAASAPGQS